MRVVAESSHDLPMVGVTISFRAGAVHDPLGRSGVARLVGRMLRRGCDGSSAEQIDERLDLLGADLGVAVGLGSTTIHVELLRRSLDAVAELVGRLLAAPSFPPGELERLKRQTEAEIVESRDNDGYLAGRALRRQLFDGHPHGVRVTGLIPTVRQVERDDLVRFHRQHFHRNGAIVGIWGDLTPSEADRLAQRMGDVLPEGPAPSYPVPELAPLRDRRLVLVDKPERQQTQIAIGTLGTHPHDDDHVALLVANTALGGTFTSRLVQEIRTKRGWSYGAASSLSAGRVREIFSLWSAPAVSDAPPCVALLLELLSAWCERGITAAELEFCQSYLRRSYAFEVDTPRKRVGQGLERELLDLPADFHSGFVERVGAVTLAEANRAVRRRIDPRGLWVSVVGAADELEPQLRAAVPDLAQLVVTPHDAE